VDVEVVDGLLAAVPSAVEAGGANHLSKRSRARILLSNSEGRDMSRSCLATGMVRQRVLEEELDLAMFFPSSVEGWAVRDGLRRLKLR
jgi:hypothetical protein